MFALGLRQFALSEKKLHLAKDFALNFRQIWAAGESQFWEDTTKENRYPYVFGIIGKLFKNAREWCSFCANTLKPVWVIQVSNLGIDIFLTGLGHIFPFSSLLIYVDFCLINQPRNYTYWVKGKGSWTFVTANILQLVWPPFWHVGSGSECGL